MLVTVFGTTGELIKLAPILRALHAQSAPSLILTTAQQAQQIDAALAEFGLPLPTLRLADGNRGNDLEHLPDIPIWLGTVARRFVRHRRSLSTALAAATTQPMMLVHGDTMTTVLGALMGRQLGIPVGHVEAGLRSGNWRSPFPEELDRRMTSRLAKVHYAPGSWAAGNLRDAGVRGEIIDTGSNTIRDSLALVGEAESPLALPGEPFGVVSLHRFELLGQPGKLAEILEILQRAAERTPLLFVDHSVTVSAVRRAGLDHVFNDRFVRIPRQRYREFIALLKQSEFLVTDSGGSQEECAALGLPCLVHRDVTERQDGLDGGSVVLTRGDISVLRRFLDDPNQNRRTVDQSLQSPTKIIVDDLVARRVI